MRRLAVGIHELRPRQPVEDSDRAEEIANRLLDTFRLDVNDVQFDELCETIERTALREDGAVKDHRSITGVCRAVAESRLPDDVRAAVLLVLLKEPFRRVKARVQ